MRPAGDRGRVLIVLAVALPLLIAATNWLVPPRRPDLTRRTAIA